MSESTASAGDGESGNELWAPPFPEDLLPRIAARLTGADHAALRATCRSWRAIFSAVAPSLRPGLLPFLLLPPHFVIPDPLCLSHRTPPHPSPLPDYPLSPIVLFPRLDHGHSDSPFFPLDSLRNPTFRPLPSLSDTARHVCVGSSHGWLILLGPTSHISLLNPLTADTIPSLPRSPLSPFPFPSTMRTPSTATSSFGAIHLAGSATSPPSSASPCSPPTPPTTPPLLSSSSSSETPSHPALSPAARETATPRGGTTHTGRSPPTA